MGYLAASDKTQAEALLQKAQIQELFDLTKLPEEAVPKGARYMYPFAGTKEDGEVQGTVEGETVLSALQHLAQVFPGDIAYIAEHAPKNAEERRLFEMQTATLLEAFAPKKKEPLPEVPAPEVQTPPKSVSTVLDRQFYETLHEVRTQTTELLRERQYAEEVQEMHRIILTLEQPHDLELKEKYDALSYILRELSYIEDGLDPSPLKKTMRTLIDRVVSQLKKVEKSMVRTAFHMDNVRIQQEKKGEPVQPVKQATEEAPVEDHEVSRYTSRKRLVAEVMLGIRALQAGQGSLSVAGTGGTVSMPLPVSPEQPTPTSSSHLGGEEHHHASEPLSHLLFREFPMFLEWFVGFSVLITIFGQIVLARQEGLLIAGYDLQKLLAPFAWQQTFLKTTLIAAFILVGLRAYKAFSSIWRWLTMVVLVLATVLVLLAL